MSKHKVVLINIDIIVLGMCTFIISICTSTLKYTKQYKHIIIGVFYYNCLNYHTMLFQIGGSDHVENLIHIMGVLIESRNI